MLATGFSHGFGASAANRELVSWLREHNATRDPADRITLYGFDPPIEMMGATSRAARCACCTTTSPRTWSRPWCWAAGRPSCG